MGLSETIKRITKLAIRKFQAKKENHFEYFISLGYNCEVMHRFLKHFYFEESNLFNWTYSFGINDITYALNNFDELGNNDFNLPNPLWECKSSHIKFHSKAPTTIYIEKTATEEDYRKDKEELISRIKYLKEKFISLAKNNERKLYIYKIKKEDIDNSVNEKIENLIQALNNIGAKNFKLMVVAEEEYKNYFKEGNYIFKTVKYFADDNDVMNEKYMPNGWDEIYREFYPTKSKGKDKKYKFEKDEKAVLPDVLRVKKYGAYYKKQGIPYIFEILTYRKANDKIKEIRLFNIRIKRFKKGKVRE